LFTNGDGIADSGNYVTVVVEFGLIGNLTVVKAKGKNTVIARAFEVFFNEVCV